MLADLQQRADAAGLNARVQEGLATVAALAEEYAVLHVQRVILREALEADAARHASPLLQAAGRVLERLTGGRWVALQAEDDGAGARRLHVVRHDNVLQTLTSLSEGTADQVFLALRLAGIVYLQNERLRAGQSSVPVVLDDVLMAFDDERASSALGALADVAAGTDAGGCPMQVILFTHHEHLAHLVEELGRDDILVVHLEGRTLPGERIDPDLLRESATRSSATLTAAARVSSSIRQAATSSPRSLAASPRSLGLAVRRRAISSLRSTRHRCGPGPDRTASRSRTAAGCRPISSAGTRLLSQAEVLGRVPRFSVGLNEIQTGGAVTSRWRDRRSTVEET